MAGCLAAGEGGEGVAEDDECEVFEKRKMKLVLKLKLKLELRVRWSLNLRWSVLYSDVVGGGEGRLCRGEGTYL